MLISIDILKELPITLILRPFNFDTFATQAYVYATQDMLEYASGPSLFLILFASIFILLSKKYFERVLNCLTILSLTIFLTT